VRGLGQLPPIASLNASSVKLGKRPVSVTEGSSSPNTVAILYRRVDEAFALIIPMTLAHYMMHARSDVGHVI